MLRRTSRTMPELLSYWMAANDASQLLRYTNDCMATGSVNVSSAS